MRTLEQQNKHLALLADLHHCCVSSRSAELHRLQPPDLAHIGGAHVLLVASVCTASH